MSQTALQGIGINYDWTYKSDGWKPGMDANLAIANGLLGLRIQAVTDAEPSIAAAPDLSNAGKCWIVGASPAAWATGKAGYIAIRNGSTATWIFIAPTAAMQGYLNVATGEFMAYVQGAWTATFTDPNDSFPVRAHQVVGYGATPPTPSSPGDNGSWWAVADGATGAWAGKDGKLAGWYVPPGKSTGEWRFVQPQKGWRVLSDDIPFTDTLALYGGITTYRDFLYSDGTSWVIENSMRRTQGPGLAMDLSGIAAAPPAYVRVLTLEEAASPFIVVALAPPGANVFIRYPAAANAKVPTQVTVVSFFTSPTARITVDWGDGTEVPGSSGYVGVDPGLGGPAPGASTANIISGVVDVVTLISSGLGALSAVASGLLNSASKGDAEPPRPIDFAGGSSYDLITSEESNCAILTGAGSDSGVLLYTDEAAANTLRITQNPLWRTSVLSGVIKFTVAQKGVGVTTIVLDNTVTGTNNANDILIAIAPAAMAQGESRVIRHQPGGGTGGLGDAWIITNN